MIAARAERLAVAASVVATLESVAHAEVVVAAARAERSAAIPRASVVLTPRVAATIAHIHRRTMEVEVVAVRIAGIDGEVPAA